MDDLMQDPVNLWLLAGAAVIAFEAFTAPGLGLFLGGLGALCTALLIKAGVVGPVAVSAQFAWFFGLTVVWTVVLWRPMRRFRLKRKAHGGDIKNNNLIGDTAIVARAGLKRGETGQVLWSGTVMNAELESSAASDVPEGAKVKILAVSGNTLTVTLK